MASSLNRTAVILDLAAFLGVSAFCISTQPTLIQQDILKRCQDTLLANRIMINGLSVDGRDVLVAGPAGSAIVSSQARDLLSRVSGVRTVAARVLSSSSALSSNAASGSPATSDAPAAEIPRSAAGVQEKIDRILDNHSIDFKPNTTTLTLESDSVLDKVVVYLAAAPALSCEIRGYDTQPGGLHQNWQLALQRALAIQDALEAKGIADWRLSTRAFHIGDGPDGRRSDREVDLVVRGRE